MLKTTLVIATALLLAGCSTAPTPPPAAPASVGTIARLDPAFDTLVPADARIEKLAGGFTFTEGPLWRPSGALWFSDVVGNVVRQWAPDGTVTEVLQPGGYDGNSLPAGGFIGPNGMTADKDGAVLLCQHGNRRIVRIAPDRKVTTLVDKFEGKKLNSPNDLVFHSDGSLYFTDPPYGLPKQDDDPAKELKFNGVYRLAGGKLQLLVKDMTRPNGIAFSPDEKTLYVANSDEKTQNLDALRRGRRRHRQQRQSLRRRDRRKGDWSAGRDEGRFAGERLRHRPRRRLGLLARRQASGHHQAAGDSRPTAAGATTASRCT